MIAREKLYLSSIAPDAAEIAQKEGLGLEIAEFCTASNMDADFSIYDARVKTSLSGVSHAILHAPFNELFPSAIDPKALELARYRYLQAARVAQSYGMTRIIVHSGYVPLVYHPSWFVERSVLFWKDLLSKLPPQMELMIENVLEDSPELLRTLVKGVNQTRFRLCLDIGHANICGALAPAAWLAQSADCIGHFHIHNNAGDVDAHAPVLEGNIDITEFLMRAQTLCPDATYTLETRTCGQSVVYLAEAGLLAP